MPETSKKWDLAYGGTALYPSVLSQHRSGEQRFYIRFKRCTDFIAAAIGLFMLGPLFLLISLGLKIENPKGSVFFRQIRIGKDGRPFHIIKFRTMVTKAEEMLNDLLEQNEVAGKMFKIKNDPRITRFGKLLRKTSIDELPQLLNVLRGEMSLVGPRPPLPREVEQYSPHDIQRLLVVPGCTGLWQVSGRNALSFDQMVELDLHYIQNRNIRMDLLVILKTVKVMIFPNNAY